MCVWSLLKRVLRGENPSNSVLSDSRFSLSLSRVVVLSVRLERTLDTTSYTNYLVDPASSICLSQRLSHACLSTSRSVGETANGSINQLWFLRTIQSYLDNCGNSRANTCFQAPTRGASLRGRALLLDQNQSRVLRLSLHFGDSG